MFDQAWAQGAGGEVGGNVLFQFMPLILIFVVFYFLLIRPQQKRLKQHREMLGALRRGDRVVTGGGIVGQVVRVGTQPDDELTVEIAPGVRVKVVRSTITAVLARTEPAKPARSEEPDDEDEEEAEVEPASDAATGDRPRTSSRS